MVNWKELVQSQPSIKGEIIETEPFATWFNPNCCLVISKAENKFRIYLLIYKEVFGEKIHFIKIFTDISLDRIKDRFDLLKKELDNENPILALGKDKDKELLISHVAKEKRIAKDVESLDAHIKKYDIIAIKINGAPSYHVAVYLGNEEIVHIKGHEDLSNSKWRAELGHLSDFLSDRDAKEIVINRLIVPFKKPELIKKHIEIAIRSVYGLGEYHLLKKNCEHFATLCVTGVPFSKQIDLVLFNLKGKVDREHVEKKIEESVNFFNDLEEKWKEIDRRSIFSSLSLDNSEENLIRNAEKIESENKKSKKNSNNNINMTEKEKIILLVGRTGGGKSTLANVLSGIENASAESELSTSKTREIQKIEFNYGEEVYQIVDSVGIGDTTRTQAEVLKEIVKWWPKEVERRKIKQVLFVVGERLTPEEINTYNMLKEVFFDGDFAKYATIVRTRFHSFEDEGECNKDIELLRDENNPEITAMLDSNNGFIHVDNPPVKIAGSGTRIERQIGLNKEIREESRNKLLKHLVERCEGSYELKSLKEVEKGFKMKLEEENKKIKEEIKNIKENNNKTNRSELEEKIRKLEEKIRNNEKLIKRDLLTNLMEVAKCQIL